MARVFNGSNQYLVGSFAAITNWPVSMAVWFRADGQTNQALLSLEDSTSSAGQGELVTLRLRDPADNDALAMVYSGGSSSFSFAGTTTTYSSSDWTHAAAVFASNTSRSVFLDGAGKGTNTTSRTFPNVDSVAIGSYLVSGSRVNYVDGAIMWPAIWNAALTDDEVASLAAGAHPKKIRPDALVFCPPLGGFDGDHDIDIVGGLSLTAYNSPTWTDDSPSGLIYPSVPVVGIGTAGGGGGSVQQQLMLLGTGA